MCLEGTTPQDLHYKHRHRRTAFLAQTLHVYESISGQDTNPSLVTGLWCKPYTRNQLDYRRLCELVLG